MAELIVVTGGAKPEISILDSDERVPWAGHSARYATPEIYREIKRHKTTLLFVNTRSQAELLFQELWRVNEDTLPIALHHGSLDVGQRRRVEKAMGDNALRAIVATSTLDLGIDWGDVDLVVHVGAPKGASRLAQRIGRANHRMDEPSKAILIPANRFEVLECRAALDANYLGAQDTPPLVDGGLDVLAQHVLGCACGAPFRADDLFEEVRSAAPYAGLERQTFDRVVDFVATGGYALKNYERYARIRLNKDGLWRVSNPRVAQQYRLNVGTIVEVPALNVRYVKAGSKARPRGGPVLGKIEEYFARDADAWRHLHVCRQSFALRRHPRERMLRLKCARQRRQGALLRRRQVSAFDLSRRAGPRHAGRPAALEEAARAGVGLAALPGRQIGAAQARRSADRDLSARQSPLSRRLSVRGQAGAPDARHVA